MAERRSFQCPNCGDAIGVLREHTDIVCTWKLMGWRSAVTGQEQRGKNRRQDIVEHVPATVPGCGFVLYNCQHGLKACVACDVSNHSEAGSPPENWRPLADIMREERIRHADAAGAHYEPRPQSRAVQPTAPVPIPTAKRIQMPFLGEEEPTRYKPPSGRRRTEKT